MLFSILLACSDYQVSRYTFRDGHTQPTREAGVDILWVVDDSASMFEEQDQLAAHTRYFTDFLSAAPVNFRLGLTTTDMAVDRPGQLVADPLTQGTQNLADVFADLIILDEGSRDEMGFEAALRALDPGGVNSQHFDASADLELIFFSDEDDQSSLSPEEFISGLRGYRPDAQIAINVIAGDPPEGCASLFGAADPGYKYHTAQELTTGLRESICSLEYETMLSRIALQVLGLETVFGLGTLPDPSTLLVEVDGVEVHQRERHGWIYDAGLNAIIFDGFAVPQPGAKILISYMPWMGAEGDFDASTEESIESETENTETE